MLAVVNRAMHMHVLSDWDVSVCPVYPFLHSFVLYQKGRTRHHAVNSGWHNSGTVVFFYIRDLVKSPIGDSQVLNTNKGVVWKICHFWPLCRYIQKKTRHNTKQSGATADFSHWRNGNISASSQSRVGHRSRRTFSTDFEIFRRRFDGVVIYFFQCRLQIFRRRIGIFSHFFICCFYFLFKVHVNFSSVFYRD